VNLRTAARLTQPRRLRIVHVTAQLDTGGLERLLVEFARHTDADRFDLRFVSLGDRGTVASEIEQSGWLVTTLRQPRGLRPSLILRLAQFFRAWNTDIVHAHNLRPLLYAAPAARLAGAKVLHTRHGHQYRAGRRSQSQFRIASALAKRVVCVSDDSAALSRAQGVPIRKLRTIHNGIDTRRFSYSGPCATGPAVMIGRLSPEKDPESLVRAMQLVIREQPALRLEIAGAGPCMPSLIQLTRDLNLESHIHFHGEVKNVAQLLARASMFILPSRTEGISLTLLEAMSRGLPVIATRVGGTPEVIEENTSGLMVAPQNPQQLAQAILQIHSGPSRARLMGLAAHHRVATHFDVRRMINDYEDLYLQCATRRQTRTLPINIHTANPIAQTQAA